MSFDPLLLAPEEEPEEIYPYRRVWRTGWFEVWMLFVAVAGIYVVSGMLGLLFVDSRSAILKIGIAVLPLLAWLVFSLGGERRAVQPREGLLSVLILGALVANGIAIPLEERVFTPDRWLPSAGFFGRVLGHMFTVGVTAEFLKYAVMRYSVWPGRFRQRQDGIAYALAASLGYAMVYNMRAALDADITLVATSMRVASITYSQVGVGLIMGFFLAELKIGRVPVFWLPAGLGLAAFVSGLYYGFRGVATVSGLGASPLRGLLLAFGLVAVMFVIVAFIVENADARMETATGRRELL